MTNAKFAKEKNGYDKTQVDTYIEKLSEAYQTMSVEYQDISNKYNDLLEQSKNYDAREQAELNSDVIAKALVNAEILARKTIIEAKSEAEDVIAEAQKVNIAANAKTAEAEESAQVILNAARAQAVKAEESAKEIISAAEAEAAKAEELAQEIIADANAEAKLIIAQATVILERTHNTMTQTSGELDKLLAHYLPEREYMRQATDAVEKLLELHPNDNNNSLAS